MSLILDALNRSQAERSSDGEVPGIETQHWVEPLPYSGRWQRSLPWLALGLAVLVIVWLLLSGKGQPMELVAPAPVETNSNFTQAESVPLESPEVTFVEEKAAPVTVAQEAVSAPADKLAANEGKIAHQSAGNSATSAAVANLYGTTDEAGASVEVAPVAEAGAQAKPQLREEPAAKPQDIEQAIDIEKMVNLARQEAENAELAEHPTPFLSRLSQQAKDQVPSIYYTQHDYSSIASQSSVTLNGKLVHVGGSVSGKIKVLEILPNSVVLSHRGTEFRLKALNSWINL